MLLKNDLNIHQQEREMGNKIRVRKNFWMAKGTLSEVNAPMIIYKKKNDNLYQKQKVTVSLHRASKVKKKKTVLYRKTA